MDFENVKALQWARVYKIIVDAKNQILTIYDLAEKLGVKPNSLELEKALMFLQRQGRVKIAFGNKPESVMPCRTVYIPTEKKSKRESII